MAACAYVYEKSCWISKNGKNFCKSCGSGCDDLCLTQEIPTDGAGINALLAEVYGAWCKLPEAVEMIELAGNKGTKVTQKKARLISTLKNYGIRAMKFLISGKGKNGMNLFGLKPAKDA